MTNKILIGSIVLFIVVVLPLTIFTLIKGPAQNVSSFFNTNFMSALSQQVTTGLSPSRLSPVEITKKDIGEVSPFAGKVGIVKTGLSSVKSTDLQSEYIEIIADTANKTSINISNWSLQSMVSGVWIGIPKGVISYEAGAVNKLNDIYLNPGDVAYVASRESPVGYSLRVNSCSGFLGTTQTFEPSISTSCVSPARILPATIKNIQVFGDACVAFAAKFNSCTYLIPSTPGFSSLSSTCRNYLQPRLTYNYCKKIKESDSSFYNARSWRIFLNQKRTLWKNQYDVVRLLDSKNRTVDIINY